MPDRLYLDHAATTPMTLAARHAVADGMARWANPSSPHAEGRAARAALEKARAAIAAAHGWTGEIILTSGASEALAIALTRATATHRLVSAVEHDAVFRACADAEVLPVGEDGVLLNPPRHGASGRIVPRTILDHAGHGHPDAGDRPAQPDGGGGGPRARRQVETPLRHALRARHLPVPGRTENRTLLCVQWANSETGVRQPLAAIAEQVHADGDLLLVDAAQLPPTAADLAHADFVALSAHKHGGPPGIGALLVRDLATLTPTGGQERGYRPGTENLPGALGWAAALAEPEPLDHWAALRARLDDAVLRSGGEVVGAAAPRHPAIGSYRMPGVAAATQLIRFDMAGIAVSAGSACSSGSMKPSHVLAAMGWSETAGREVVRISFGRDTTDADIDRAIATWRDIARAARRLVAQ